MKVQPLEDRRFAAPAYSFVCHSPPIQFALLTYPCHPSGPKLQRLRILSGLRARVPECSSENHSCKIQALAFDHVVLRGLLQGIPGCRASQVQLSDRPDTDSSSSTATRRFRQAGLKQVDGVSQVDIKLESGVCPAPVLSVALITGTLIPPVGRCASSFNFVPAFRSARFIASERVRPAVFRFWASTSPADRVVCPCDEPLLSLRRPGHVQSRQ